MNSAMGYTEGSEMYLLPIEEQVFKTIQIMEETIKKPKPSFINSACKSLERQIAKEEAAVAKLIAKKNEIEVSIELLRESIEGLSSEVERLRNRE